MVWQDDEGMQDWANFWWFPPLMVSWQTVMLLSMRYWHTDPAFDPRLTKEEVENLRWQCLVRNQLHGVVFGVVCVI